MPPARKGDEVIIPAPYWLSYPEMVRWPRHARHRPDHRPDRVQAHPRRPAAAITPRTRLFILNSPSNPTGSVYTPEKSRPSGDICVEKGVLIMSDEIYEHLLYDGANTKSVASFSPAHFEHTIIVHGFAKAWSMTGWRLGMVCRARADCQSHRRHPKPQHQQPDLVRPERRRRRADRPAGPSPALAGRIQQTPRLRLAEAQQHPRPHLRQRQGRVLPLSEHCADRPQVHRVLRQAAGTEKVAAVPGIAFGADDYIRLSYATSMANIQKGLERIERFCKTLVK